MRGGGDEFFGFIKKSTINGTEKCIYSTYSPLSSTHIDFVFLTSLAHPRKILLVVLQREQEIEKVKDLSAPLRTSSGFIYVYKRM
jgi:hypothetical protein